MEAKVKIYDDTFQTALDLSNKLNVSLTVAVATIIKEWSNNQKAVASRRENSDSNM